MGKSKFCRRKNKRPIRDNTDPAPRAVTGIRRTNRCVDETSATWKRSHTRAHAGIHAHHKITATVSGILSGPWLTALSSTTCTQFGDLVSHFSLSQTRDSTVLLRILLLCCWLQDVFTFCFSFTAVWIYTLTRRNPHMQVELMLDMIQSIYRTVVGFQSKCIQPQQGPDVCLALLRHHHRRCPESF